MGFLRCWPGSSQPAHTCQWVRRRSGWSPGCPASVPLSRVPPSLPTRPTLETASCSHFLWPLCTPAHQGRHFCPLRQVFVMSKEFEFWCFLVLLPCLQSTSRCIWIRIIWRSCKLSFGKEAFEIACLNVYVANLNWPYKNNIIFQYLQSWFDVLFFSLKSFISTNKLQAW